MTPLDLTAAPPRSGRTELAGIAFMARSVDKIRASLPGGALGEYTVEGFTERMLDQIGVELAQLTTIVQNAASEDDVAAWLHEHADPAGTAAWNAFVTQRVLFGGNRAEAEEEFPWLRGRDDIVLTLDFLDEDDRRLFAATT